MYTEAYMYTPCNITDYDAYAMRYAIPMVTPTWLNEITRPPERTLQSIAAARAYNIYFIHAVHTKRILALFYHLVAPKSLSFITELVRKLG